MLVVFASVTTIDFTGYGLYLYIALWVLLLFGFITPFVASSSAQIAYALLGTLLFCFYIIYDVQLIIGGNHSLRFGVDDYVMAALMLYLDIIQLFLFILRLLGDTNNN